MYFPLATSNANRKLSVDELAANSYLQLQSLILLDMPCKHKEVSVYFLGCFKGRLLKQQLLYSDLSSFKQVQLCKVKYAKYYLHSF